MISNFNNLTIAELVYLIVAFAISTLIYLGIFRMSFKDNVCFLIKKLFQIRNSQPVLYSYRHISLVIASYFLIICSFLVLNIFYLVLAIYTYYDIPINIELVLYSEMSIQVMAILSAALIAITIILYYIRNSNYFMGLLKNNYCLLESLLSILLCSMYIGATKYSRPIRTVTSSASSFCIVTAFGLIFVYVLLHKLQFKKKENLRKLLFGNTKIKEQVAISKQENIELLYNILLCDSLTLLIIFYVNSLTSITIVKAISYILLQVLFIGITKGYKTMISVIFKTKEDK